MKYFIDIDGTICEIRKDLDFTKCEPMKTRISQVNKFYDEGHTIVLYTGRSSETRNLTTKWLKQHNVKYHELIMDKPICTDGNGRYIDDLNIHPEDFFNER